MRQLRFSSVEIPLKIAILFNYLENLYYLSSRSTKNVSLIYAMYLSGGQIYFDSVVIENEFHNFKSIAQKKKMVLECVIDHE